MDRRKAIALMSGAVGSLSLPAEGKAMLPAAPRDASKPATLEIRGIVIGDGATKTIVSLIERNVKATLAQAQKLAAMPEVDVVEFRLDHLDAVDDKQEVARLSSAVAQAVAPKPLIITFRTKAEGGEKAIEPGAYASLYAAIAAANVGDLFDIQAAMLNAPEVADTMKRLQAAGRRVILSHHDFQRTPSEAEMLHLLRAQQAQGADICKLAVMPHDAGDVLRLLSATWTMRSRYADRPLITMSMNGIGAVSRLSGEIFGSSMSFGSVGRISAPGQMPVASLQASVETLHRSLHG
ncbi:type I 3-dehydroquinate dehydratase [Granulicella cerasi]|uniref:3-dehydroquinate dehydratase n=1 Tax=Granulicella cerasi TaxID=741063 RepID=A0ABW1Z930_9BACT|nr:type I 3-dehydroquinate dehydratase [Granulicella cerasi]